MITFVGVIFVKYEYDYGHSLKFGGWAKSIPDSIDFVDYWFNLFLSKTKAQIEEHKANTINAFHWTRWKEDFESFVDMYQPFDGVEVYYELERSWFARYMQYLVCGLQLPSAEIARWYGKDQFREIIRNWFRYHTFGGNLFVEYVISEHGGLPPGAIVTNVGR